MNPRRSIFDRAHHWGPSVIADPETLRLTRVCASGDELIEGAHLAPFLPASDSESVAIIVLTRLAVDGVIP